MDDQRTDRAGGGSMLRRILKWLTFAAWGYTLVVVVFTAIHARNGNSLGYSAGAEVSVLSGSVALTLTCVYVLVVFVEKRFFTRRQ
jgi:hypothetical protein